MSNKIISKCLGKLPVILIAGFALVSALCLFFICDDFIWYFVKDVDALKTYQVPNGRYFSNFITYIIVRSSLIRTLFYSITLTLLIVSLSKIIDFEKKLRNLKYITAFTLFLLIPKEMYSEVLNWISGYTNYAFVFLLTSFYMIFSFKVAFTDYTPHKFTILFLLPLSFLGGLCVEHVTIYNLIYSIAIIFIIYKLRKRLFIHNFTYLFGTIAAAVVMFSNDAYSSIAIDGDNIGNRGFEFSITDIYMQTYRFVITHYAREFWSIHFLIGISFLFIYYKLDISNKNSLKHKYAIPCFVTIFSYAVYSLFTSCFETFKPLNMSMKIRAIETAFAFVYVISLAYLIIVLLNKNVAIRCIIYLFSTLIVSMPFVIVSPVTARCFFVDYMFWILLSGEIFAVAFECSDFLKSKIFTSVCTAIPIILGMSICGIDISNKYYNTLRFKYIEEQIDNNVKNVEFISLPYDSYTNDDLSDINIFEPVLDNDNSYGMYIFMYYDINLPDLNDFQYMLITCQDYNTVHN